MYSKAFSLVLFLLIGLLAQAQTKRIAHKSHSGSEATFKVALEKKLFDIEYSNFGMAPTRRIKIAQLDTLKFISDSIAVMVTSQYCKEVNRFDDSWKGESSIWRAGTDTVYKHPLFSKQNDLDTIKKVLEKDYNFQNSVDSIVFIGYDNALAKPSKRHKKKKKQRIKKNTTQKAPRSTETTESIAPLIIADHAPPTVPPKMLVKNTGLSTWIYISIIALLSLLIGTVARQIQQFRQLSVDYK